MEIYGAHVDDCVTGGHGSGYKAAIQRLQAAFKFRKWSLGSSDFCGAQYEQDPQTFEVTMSQCRFVEKVQLLQMSRDRARDKTGLISDKEISCL